MRQCCTVAVYCQCWIIYHAFIVLIALKTFLLFYIINDLNRSTSNYDLIKRTMILSLFEKYSFFEFSATCSLLSGRVGH